MYYNLKNGITKCNILRTRFTNHFYKLLSTKSYNDEFKITYKYNHILATRFITRLKIFQTTFTIALVPLSLYYNSIGLMELNNCITATLISIFASVMLIVISINTQKILCLVSANKSLTMVKFSTFNFWGRRMDTLFKIDDIVPPGDIGENLNDIYVKIKVYSDPNKMYYFPFKHGQVLDYTALREIFKISF